MNKKLSEKHIKFIGLIIGLVLGTMFFIGTMNEVIHSNNNKKLNRGQILHRSCAAKVLNIYENCYNIREEGMFVSWNVKDNTDDIYKISIMKSGIIEIKYYKE